MNETKRNRMLAAVTVNAIILIAVLAAVVIYQLVDILVLTKRRSALETELKTVQEKIENTQDTLDYYKSESYLLDKAFEYGFVYGDKE